MRNDSTKALSKVIRIDEEEIRGHLDELVRGTEEDVDCSAECRGRCYVSGTLRTC